MLRTGWDAEENMMTPWVTLLAIAMLAMVYVVVPVVGDVFARYRRRRTLRCPETGTDASVQIDARHAALTAIPGPPELRVEDCSLWPERKGCQERCVHSGPGPVVLGS
jgi:hypothetical protein